MPVVTTTAYDAGAWGVGLVHRLDGRLVEHELPEPRRAPTGAGEPAGDPVVALLLRYFRGERVAFTSIDIEPALAAMGASSFEGAVLRELHAVPYGTTIGYGELAARAGHPRAGRAAGSVCARGILDLIVPYHRVIAADGSIGRYGPSGVRRKQHLLAHEGVRVVSKVVGEGVRA